MSKVVDFETEEEKSLCVSEGVVNFPIKCGESSNKTTTITPYKPCVITFIQNSWTVLILHRLWILQSCTQYCTNIQNGELQ